MSPTKSQVNLPKDFDNIGGRRPPSGLFDLVVKANLYILQFWSRNMNYQRIANHNPCVANHRCLLLCVDPMRHNVK